MEQVGRYAILGRLGRGGMSTVYKAQAPVTGRIVALKILRPRDEIFADLVGMARLKEMFVEEARIMGAISHENVAEIVDCDEHQGRPFIVLEYFSHSLGDMIGEGYRVEERSRQLSAKRSYLYLAQALKGLERLHFAGIVHRDLKPYNLMLTSDDQVKIIDFGLSRVRGEEVMAIPGMQVGSPYYAAPEQARNPEGADARADLYSLGVLLYRLVTGQLVGTGQGRLELPSRLNRELDSGWDAWLLKALAVNPEDRFADAVQMRLALDEMYEQWQDGSRRNCPLQPPANTAIDPTWGKPGRMPGRIMYKDIRHRLALDELFRPRTFRSCRLRGQGPLLLEDQETGLVWQRSGSGFTLTWHQAREYVDQLNGIAFAGRSDWRLPTCEELATVLREPTAARDFCLDPLFDPTLHWLWSSDHCTKKAAWMVDIVESYFGRLDMDGAASVCAVAG